jgi:hypothetical protein
MIVRTSPLGRFLSWVLSALAQFIVALTMAMAWNELVPQVPLGVVHFYVAWQGVGMSRVLFWTEEKVLEGASEGQRETWYFATCVKSLMLLVYAAETAAAIHFLK